MEIFPKPQFDEGETAQQVGFGGMRGESLVRAVVAGKKVDGKIHGFNSELVLALFAAIYLPPHFKPMLRQTDSTTVGGKGVAHFEELPHKLFLFGRWLEEEMDNVKKNPEDIVNALRVAAAAHYGLTMPSFHPFENANGRTARALMNAILMSETMELRTYGHPVLPIPIVRLDKDSDHYIRSLQAVIRTGTLNPFMSFIAAKWVENLQERLKNINQKIVHPNQADLKLIEKFKGRIGRLTDFVKNGARNGQNGDYQTFPTPDYFAPRYIKVSHVETF